MSYAPPVLHDAGQQWSLVPWLVVSNRFLEKAVERLTFLLLRLHCGSSFGCLQFESGGQLDFSRYISLPRTTVVWVQVISSPDSPHRLAEGGALGQNLRELVASLLLVAMPSVTSSALI